MFRSARPRLLIVASGCLLLPVWAPGESRIASDPPHSMQHAAAHVLIKVVIPQVLAMEIVDDQLPGGHVLAISGNGEKVYRVPAAGEAARGSLILNKAGHRSIAQFAACDAAEPARAVPRISCTVSMP